MNKIFLTKTALFRGVHVTEVDTMLKCLGAFTKQYAKSEVIYHAGEIVDCIGLVLSGSVNITTDDFWGNAGIFNHVCTGEIFAETYAGIPGEALLINVVAAEKTEVLFLNIKKMIITCSNSCGNHNLLIKNLLQITSKRNLELSRRMLHTSSKSIRGRLISYFSEQIAKEGSCQFTIPFNRQQLADYLSVDRSAMSNELSKMKKEGILTFNKNRFELLKTD